MIHIEVSNEIKNVCPQFIGAALTAQIKNTSYSESLWQEINRFEAQYRESFTTDSIKEHPAILATRQIYKRCGKDPSRYRPSSEALIRRMLKGHKLYQINTAVDLINLASIRFGYSIGGFDADKIDGDSLCLGIGKADEPYEGIGRGPLNIEGLPVYRDQTGGIGTPTSDHERTKLSETTTHILAVINGYDGNKQQVLACAQYMQELFQEYTQAQETEINLFSPNSYSK